MVGCHVTFIISREAADIVSKLDKGTRSKFVSNLILNTQSQKPVTPIKIEERTDYGQRCYLCPSAKFLFRLANISICAVCRDQKIAEGQYETLIKIVPNEEEYKTNGRPNPIQTAAEQSPPANRDVIEIPIYGDNQ